MPLKNPIRILILFSHPFPKLLPLLGDSKSYLSEYVPKRVMQHAGIPYIKFWGFHQRISNIYKKRLQTADQKIAFQEIKITR